MINFIKNYKSEYVDLTKEVNLMKMSSILQEDIIKYLKELSEIEEKRGTRIMRRDMEKAGQHFLKVGEIRAAIGEVEKL